jgi:hypothetical protein
MSRTTSVSERDASHIAPLDFYQGSTAKPSLAVDGSVTPQKFFYPEIGYPDTVVVEKVQFTGAQAAIAPSKFIGIAALGTGMEVEAVESDDTLIKNFLGHSIKTNYDFSQLAGSELYIIDENGVAIDQISMTWELSGLGHLFLIPPGQHIKLTVNDDLSSVYLDVHVQGFIQGD